MSQSTDNIFYLFFAILLPTFYGCWGQRADDDHKVAFFEKSSASGVAPFCAPSVEISQREQSKHKD